MPRQFVHHDPEASEFNNLFEVVIIIPCFPDVPISQRRLTDRKCSLYYYFYKTSSKCFNYLWFYNKREVFDQSDQGALRIYVILNISLVAIM